MKKYIIHVTVMLDKGFWVGIFKRNDNDGFAVARHVFGAEPTDPELYNFITEYFYKLKFTQPTHDFDLVIKRKKFKRAMREAKSIMRKAKSTKIETIADETLRLELEKNKKIKKKISSKEKETEKQRQFQLRQEKKKKKQRGH